MFVYMAGIFKTSQLRRALPALVTQRYEEAKLKVCSLYPWVGGDGNINGDGDSEGDDGGHRDGFGGYGMAAVVIVMVVAVVVIHGDQLSLLLSID